MSFHALLALRFNDLCTSHTHETSLFPTSECPFPCFPYIFLPHNEWPVPILFDAVHQTSGATSIRGQSHPGQFARLHVIFKRSFPTMKKPLRCTEGKHRRSASLMSGLYGQRFPAASPPCLAVCVFSARPDNVSVVGSNPHRFTRFCSDIITKILPRA